MAPDNVRALLARQLVRPIAHRGLHDVLAGRIENTVSAFEAAIGETLAIECDVQASADGEPVVFHDFTLDRLTGRSGLVAALTRREIERVRHTGNGEPIVALDDLLSLIDGRVPLVVEIKHDGGPVDPAYVARIGEICTAAKGTVAVMSFSAAVMSSFEALAPHILRGLVVSGPTPADNGPAVDFVARDVRDLSAPLARSERHQPGEVWPLLTWTVRTQTDLDRAMACADAPIFEAIDPEAVRAAMAGRNLQAQ